MVMSGGEAAIIDATRMTDVYLDFATTRYEDHKRT